MTDDASQKFTDQVEREVVEYVLADAAAFRLEEVYLGPSQLNYEHGRVGIGGFGDVELDKAWRSDLPLAQQWGGLTRLV